MEYDYFRLLDIALEYFAKNDPPIGRSISGVHSTIEGEGIYPPPFPICEEIIKKLIRDGYAFRNDLKPTADGLTGTTYIGEVTGLLYEITVEGRIFNQAGGYTTQAARKATRDSIRAVERLLLTLGAVAATCVAAIEIVKKAKYALTIEFLTVVTVSACAASVSAGL